MSGCSPGPAASRYGEGFRLSNTTRAVLDGLLDEVGASVVGRGWFDVTDGWGGNPPFQGEVFVLTHEPPTEWRGDLTRFTFVKDGIESPVARARAAAGKKNVGVRVPTSSSNAQSPTCWTRSNVHVIPVLLGDGVRLFERLSHRIELEQLHAICTAHVTHLRYRVVR